MSVPPLVIRRAGPEDAEAVRTLTRAAYAKWVPVIGREPWPMTADYDRAVREHRIDLAFADTVLVGLVEMAMGDADVLIENLAVDPAHQARGVGETLLGHAEAIATEAGFPRLRLYTNARFATNIAFYRRRGFVVQHEDKIADGIVVHMAKIVGERRCWPETSPL